MITDSTKIVMDYFLRVCAKCKINQEKVVNKASAQAFFTNNQATII